MTQQDGMAASRSRYGAETVLPTQGSVKDFAKGEGASRLQKLFSHTTSRQLASGLAIAQWWFFNCSTLLLNKWIFQVYGFHFPLTLSTIHFIISSLGAYVVLVVLKLKPLVEVKPVDKYGRLLPMSAIFCLNIVLGNVSLSYIPVSLMQTVKSLTPATTMLLQRLVWGKAFALPVWLSLVPVVGGIILTSVTELSFVLVGFLAALAGCFATSTKTILAEALLHGKYSFDSINTVYHMAPTAALLLLIPALFLEGPGVQNWAASQPTYLEPTLLLAGSGLLAFSLNYSIFYVIHSTSALTFNVAGNAKTAIAIVTSWMLFRNPMSWWNALGCTVTISGCTYYGYVRQQIAAQKAGVSNLEETIPLVRPSRPTPKEPV